jgi:hypothetical protein
VIQYKYNRENNVGHARQAGSSEGKFDANNRLHDFPEIGLYIHVHTNRPGLPCHISIWSTNDVGNQRIPYI